MQASIRLDRLAHVLKRIENINRQALKRGFQGFTYELGKPFTVTRKAPNGEKWLDDMIEISVRSDLPSTPGYHIVGIRNETDGIPYYSDNLPPVYRELKNPVCAHCQTQRKRNFFAVVTKENEHEEMVIGSRCFAHIFGDTSAEGLIAFGNFIHQIYQECLDDPDATSYSAPHWYSVERYLGVVTRLADKDGFLSSSKAEGTLNIPTWLQARDLYSKPVKTTVEIKATVASILQHVKSFDISRCSAYEANLLSCLREDFVPGKKLPLVASAYACYQRAQQRREEQESKLPSDYIGAPKKRLELELKLKHKAPFDSAFGGGINYIFEANNKDSVVWKTTSSLTCRYQKKEICPEDGEYVYEESYFPKVGDVIKLKATVKEHGEYVPRRQENPDPVKTTYISRPKLLAAVRGNETIVPVN